jgi:hypothetical protein
MSLSAHIPAGVRSFGSLSLVLLGAASVCCATSVLDQTDVADPTAIVLTSYTDFTNGEWSLGFEFSPTSNIDVTSLGSFFPSGATDQHGVGLWTSGGTLIASTTVTGTGTEGFDYSAITPVLLLAGQDYVVSASTLTDDYADNSPTFLVAPDLDYIEHMEISCTTVAACFPTAAITSFDDFGANFTYTVVAPAVVPEPSTWSMSIIAGAVALFGMMRRRKRRIGYISPL